MEKVDATKIFERSVQRYGLYYTTFYGDGDSKRFSAVQKIYGPEKSINKFECIRHYQKRVGNRLRKLRKEKKLGGKNRLTNAKIDILQSYFGMPLRQNRNLQNMMDAIMASLFHVSEYHEKCPRNSDTWCLYQKDKIDGTHLYKSKNGLPLDVRKEIMPVMILRSRSFS